MPHNPAMVAPRRFVLLAAALTAVVAVIAACGGRTTLSLATIEPGESDVGADKSDVDAGGAVDAGTTAEGLLLHCPLDASWGNTFYAVYANEMLPVGETTVFDTSANALFETSTLAPTAQLGALPYDAGTVGFELAYGGTPRYPPPGAYTVDNQFAVSLTLGTEECRASSGSVTVAEAEYSVSDGWTLALQMSFQVACGSGALSSVAGCIQYKAASPPSP